jgi:phosphoribosylformylglycinamidine (FGAM) synthase-like amidotransferase family enzyme
VKEVGQNKISVSDFTKAVAEGSETPLLDFEALTRCSRWLMSEDPRLAYQVLFLRGGFSTGDTHFTDPLKTAEQVHQALSAFENLDQMKPGTIQGNDIYVLGILERWKALESVGPGEFRTITLR